MLVSLSKMGCMRAEGGMERAEWGPRQRRAQLEASQQASNSEPGTSHALDPNCEDDDEEGEDTFGKFVSTNAKCAELATLELRKSGGGGSPSRLTRSASDTSASPRSSRPSAVPYA